MTVAAVERSPSRRRTSTAIAVTRWGVHVPGASASNSRLAALIDGTAVPPARAHELLGRKRLLAKEPATRLGLCAVHAMLGRPALAPRPEGPADPRAAVVVASNLGNMDAVVRVTRAVRDGSGRDVSPLDAPNASSNVVASTIAIWFRYGGPNLMVCSGATAGLDALRLGMMLLRADRADKVVVVGAEPDDEVAAAVHAARCSSAGSYELRGSAAAVLLEQNTPGMPAAPTLGPISVAVGAAPFPAGIGSLRLAPRAAVHGDGELLDLEYELGGMYGALGVIQVAAAAAILARGDQREPIAVLCGDDQDGWRTTTISPPDALEVER